MHKDFQLLRLYKERRSAIETRICLDEGGEVDVDRLFPIFLESIWKTFMFIRRTQSLLLLGLRGNATGSVSHQQQQPFLKRFCKRNIFECFRENCREKVTRTKS